MLYFIMVLQVQLKKYVGSHTSFLACNWNLLDCSQ